MNSGFITLIPKYMKSLSEIETTSKRASKAAGFSWGISEEIAKGIRLLELFGLPGIKNLNQYFENKEKKKFENLTIINQNNKLIKSSYCPINLGVSFLDQVKKLETIERYKFQEIAYPLLLIPFLSRASEIVGKKILLKEEFPSSAINAEICFLENKDSFSDAEWKNLYKLSENTFVEETDSLKKGAAGAGLTDND